LVKLKHIFQVFSKCALSLKSMKLIASLFKT